MKKALLFGVTTAVMGIISYPLFDFLLCMITKTNFEYSLIQHLIEPIIFGIVIAVVLYIPLNDKGNKKKK